MQDISEEAIRANCPHCDRNSSALKYKLQETNNFYIVCDVHPIVEGHILIIPKAHLSCIAEYPEDVYREFLMLNEKVYSFLRATYKKVSSFEHGIWGQTVFHSHVHYLPFSGEPTAIVSEGLDKLAQISSIGDLKEIFSKNKGYLFFTIGTSKWIVDKSLVAPRFFRDRFAKALGKPERGNWKAMEVDEVMMEKVAQDDIQTQEKWKDYFNQSITDMGFKETIDWYNKHAEEFVNRAGGLETPENIETFVNLVGKGKKILDVGCGSGRDGAEIAEKGIQVVGIDISKGLLEEARKINPNLEFIETDMRSLPFEDSSFDGVWAQASLLHFERIENVEKSLREFYRILRRSGILYVSVKQQKDKKSGVEKHELTGWQRFFQYFTKEEMEDLFKKAGFEIISSDIQTSQNRPGLGWVVVFGKKI